MRRDEPEDDPRYFGRHTGRIKTGRTCLLKEGQPVFDPVGPATDKATSRNTGEDHQPAAGPVPREKHAGDWWRDENGDLQHTGCDGQIRRATVGDSVRWFCPVCKREFHLMWNGKIAEVGR